ncbi:MAG: hypothetical protein BMS9Abin28_1867 [Anaerolineae bacterium]|nr:MAG: hypothetical protein BMS9Abin28_1867 [Anaerolineae bacterium]
MPRPGLSGLRPKARRIDDVAHHARACEIAVIGTVVPHGNTVEHDPVFGPDGVVGDERPGRLEDDDPAVRDIDDGVVLHDAIPAAQGYPVCHGVFCPPARSKLVVSHDRARTY